MSVFRGFTCIVLFSLLTACASTPEEQERKKVRAAKKIYTGKYCVSTLMKTQSGCGVINACPIQGEYITWSGQCENRKVTGQGTLTYHLKTQSKKVIRSVQQGEFSGGRAIKIDKTYNDPAYTQTNQGCLIETEMATQVDWYGQCHDGYATGLGIAEYHKGEGTGVKYVQIAEYHRGQSQGFFIAYDSQSNTVLQAATLDKANRTLTGLGMSRWKSKGYDNSGEYLGYYQDNHYQGYGQISYPAGHVKDGRWSVGDFKAGIMFYPKRESDKTQAWYDGYFEDNRRNGLGCMTWSDLGYKQCGRFSDGKYIEYADVGEERSFSQVSKVVSLNYKHHKAALQKPGDKLLEKLYSRASGQQKTVLAHYPTLQAGYWLLDFNNQHWIRDEQNGCYLYNDNPQPDETVQWHGRCVNGVAEGQGTTIWSKAGQLNQKVESVLFVGRIVGPSIQKIDLWDIKTNQWQFSSTRKLNTDGQRVSGWTHHKAGQYQQGCLLYEGSGYKFKTTIPCVNGYLHGHGTVEFISTRKGEYREEEYVVKKYRGNVVYGKFEGKVDQKYVSHFYDAEDYGYIYQYANGEEKQELGRYGRKCALASFFGRAYCRGGRCCAQYESFSSGKLEVPEGALTLGDIFKGLETFGQVVSQVNRAVNHALCDGALCQTSKTHNQSGNTSSNVQASADSLGSARHVCFHFNNTLEMDTGGRLEIRNNRDPNLTTDSAGLFGSHCISGSELGGQYTFTYSTQNRMRSADFSISGDHSDIYIELSENFIKNQPFDIYIIER